MRLDDFDPNINVEDQRGSGGGFGGFGGGGGVGGFLPLILGMVGSRFGCGGIVVVLLLFAVFGGLGNLGGLVGGGGQVAGPSGQSVQRSDGSVQGACTLNTISRATCAAYSSTENTWEALFRAQGQTFDPPKLVFFSGTGQSGCGVAQSAMGPFYCPPDQGIYIDTSFFDELANRFGASGDFAQYYVVAHEMGHHIQNITGTSDQVRRAQARASETEGNQLSVRLELQADCYAGVWAAQNRERLEPGDVEEGLRAAQAIGDDALQRQAQGRVVPDSFTHGSSEQRMRWLRVGLETGDPARCDTFSGAV
ncbi:KPN_02809 family neutral zinc metallopeptidase [Sphingomonas lenta]|uniref:Zinc metalloprotease n=1 Tax=Sphingomonas lenta TaxID=1141887 RepID=A0A2A2SHR4_9SPHN|nr:neutral zinc metallopeptidase [Sphingomonas lenta]PAX08772.1 zinc metalloprotease [Sphingomonas lenta]